MNNANIVFVSFPQAALRLPTSYENLAFQAKFLFILNSKTFRIFVYKILTNVAYDKINVLNTHS